MSTSSVGSISYRLHQHRIPQGFGEWHRSFRFSIADRSGRSRLTPAEDEENVFLIRSCGHTSIRAAGVGLGGLVPTSPGLVFLGGLAPPPAIFVDFRQHGGAGSNHQAFRLLPAFGPLPPRRPRPLELHRLFPTAPPLCRSTL